MNPVELFETEFSKFVGSKYAVAVSSGTAALHTGLEALELKPGDKVITTPYTFPSTVNAIIMCGATPLFADIGKVTLLVDPDKIRELLEAEKGVVGILPVHLFSRICNMRKILILADQYDTWVLEDSSQALGSKTMKGKMAGTLGDIGTYSFYATKNLHCFEGGMAVTDNLYAARVMKQVRNHGLNNCEQMVRFGYNYKLSWIQAFIGYQNLLLHKPGILAEVGRFTEKDGYYPYVVYDHPWYKQNGFNGNCPVAEEMAAKVRENL